MVYATVKTEEQKVPEIDASKLDSKSMLPFDNEKFGCIGKDTKISGAKLLEQLRDDKDWLLLSEPVAKALNTSIEDLVDKLNSAPHTNIKIPSNSPESYNGFIYLINPEFVEYTIPTFKKAAPQDDFLLLRAKLEDEYAKNKILQQYELLVRKLAKLKYAHYRHFSNSDDYFPHLDINDIREFGRLGLLKAVRNYDWRQSFMTFAYICIRNNISNRIEKEETKRAKVLDKAIPLDVPSFKDENDSTLMRYQIVAKDTTGSELIGNEVLEAVLTEVINFRWKERKKNIFLSRIFCDLSMQQVGDIYGITRERVSQIQKEGFKKLRKIPRIRELAMPYL